MKKNFKKIVALAAVLVMLVGAGAVYAATAKTPADIVSGLTGKSVEDLYKERAAGKTLGTIANDAGKLEEFKAQMLEQKKIILDQQVADGKLTQAQADQIYNTMKNNSAVCDGTGNAAIGRQNGACLGQSQGMRQGMGRGMGRGMGYGASLGTAQSK